MIEVAGIDFYCSIIKAHSIGTPWLRLPSKDVLMISFLGAAEGIISLSSPNHRWSYRSSSIDSFGDFPSLLSMPRQKLETQILCRDWRNAYVDR